jgi:hypothetical protein
MSNERWSTRGFIQLPPDVDFADPETDSLCHYCGSVVLEHDDCVVCAPRCLVEDSPVRFSAQIVGHGRAQVVRYEQTDMFGFADGARLALVTWEGSAHNCIERRCVRVSDVFGGPAVRVAA